MRSEDSEVKIEKCKNMAFFHSLTAGNMEHIRKLIQAEIEHVC